MEFNATFIVSLVSFVLFVLVMNKIFYAPITKIILEREKLISDNYDEANTMNDEAENLLTQRKEKIAEAEEDARKTIAQSIQKYNEQGKVETTEARKVSMENLKDKKIALRQEYLVAKSELNNSINSFANSISEKVMGFDLTVEAGKND